MFRKLTFLTFFVLVCVLTANSADPPVEIESPEIDKMGRVSKSELLSKKKLVLNNKNHQVVSFILACTDDQLRAHTYHSNSAAFTTAMLQEIRQSPNCERFMITKLLVKTPKDTTQLHPVVFFLKE